MSIKSAFQQMNIMIRAARESTRIVKFLLAFTFFITSFVLILNHILAPNSVRLLIGMGLLLAVFALRYLIEIASPKVVLWAMAVVCWIASVASVTFSGGPASSIAISVIMVVIFAWLFIGQGAAVVFSALTLVAAFLYPIQANIGVSVLPSTEFATGSLLYILSGSVFAFAGAMMIVFSDLQDAEAAAQQAAAQAGSPTEALDEASVPDPNETPVSLEPDDQALLDMIMTLTDAGVFLMDAEDRVCRVNPAAAQMAGFSVNELVGMNFSELLRTEPKAKPADELAKMFEETGSSVFSRQMVRKDRSTLPVKIRFGAVRGAAPGENYILQIVRDISDQNALIALMRDSEQKLSAFLENTRDAVYLKNLNGKYTMINEMGASMLGRPKSDILGCTDEEIFSAEDAARIRSYDLQVIETGSSNTEESAFVLDGRSLVLRTTRMPYFSQRGEITGVISISRDMSTRKRVEADLRTIALRYQALFENNSDGVVILDLGGNVMDISDLAARMLGFAKADLIGVPFETVIPARRRSAYLAWIEKAIAGTQITIFEQDLLRQNGQIFPVEVNAGLVVEDDGTPLHLQVLFRDITDRKRIDVERIGLLQNLRTRTRQIQTAFEVSKSISSTLDFRNLLSQTVEIIKQRFDFYYVGVFLVEDGYAMLAAGSGEQGRSMLKAGHRLPIGASSMVGWCLEHKRARIALDVGRDPIHFDNPMTPNTRSELAMPLIVHSEVIGALTVQSEYPEAFNSEDVAVLQIMADQIAIAVQNARLHDRLTVYAGELEDRVLKRTFQLEQLNRELESFSYSISHDLRAPLRAINGFSNIIMEVHAEALSPDVMDYMSKINNNALRMGNLIDDILAFSRMGRQQIRKTELDPNSLIRDVLDDLHSEIKERNIDIHVDQLPIVHADASLLKQVFANLIGNAVKFTRNEGTPEIKISCMQKESTPVIFVKDNGVGFDMKYADRIFGVFQRMHRDDEFEGTGVGLAIVERIIQRHGGEIWFDAAENEGATFYFHLPAA